MAKFLNTTATTYHLEELIKKASSNLFIISPYLKLNNRIKELLEDKNRLKIDIRIVYGKKELQPDEINWLKNLSYIRTSFCKNLHAKCYMSENECIITSLNLYEFSQVNNNEMGVLISRDTDNQLYTDTYTEVQRIIRISEEVNLSADKIEPSLDKKQLEKVENKPIETSNLEAKNEPKKPRNFDKLTISKLAEKLGMTTNELSEKLEQLGYIETKGKNIFLTDKGKQAGGELKKGQYGYFTIWAVDLEVSVQDENNANLTFAEKLLKLFSF